MSRERKERLAKNRLYSFMRVVATYMDRYHVDGIVGLVPGGVGDVVTSLLSLVYVYFSVFRLRSLPLTLAVLCNILRDVLLGLIPFYVGDAIDFFNRSNVRNMRLVDGFVNDDEVVMREINKKAIVSGLLIFVFVAAIVGMFALLAWLVRIVGSHLFV